MISSTLILYSKCTFSLAAFMRHHSFQFHSRHPSDAGIEHEFLKYCNKLPDIFLVLISEIVYVMSFFFGMCCTQKMYTIYNERFLKGDTFFFRDTIWQKV